MFSLFISFLISILSVYFFVLYLTDDFKVLKLKHYFFLKINKSDFSFLIPIKKTKADNFFYYQHNINKKLKIIYKHTNKEELSLISSKVDSFNEILSSFSNESKSFRILNEKKLCSQLESFLDEISLPQNFSDTRYLFNGIRKKIKKSYLTYESYIEIPYFSKDSIFSSDLNEKIKILNEYSYEHARFFDKLRNSEFQNFVASLLAFRGILYNFSKHEEAILKTKSFDEVSKNLLKIIDDIYIISEPLNEHLNSSEAFNRKFERI